MKCCPRGRRKQAGPNKIYSFMHRLFSFKNEPPNKSIFTEPTEDITCKERGDSNSVNLAFQNIREISPTQITKAFSSVRTLDLSYNEFEYPFCFRFCINVTRKLLFSTEVEFFMGKQDITINFVFLDFYLY